MTSTSSASPGNGFTPSRRSLLLGLGALSAGLAGARSVLALSSTEFELEVGTVVTATRLDEEVARAFPEFNAGPVLPDFDAAAQGAANDVQLYRIVTKTTVPETGEVLDVTGLLALPVGASGELPIVSWQHGTILSFDQVPSNLTKLSDPDYELSDAADSLETLFNVHRFAARGFVVIAADYVGKGPLRNGRGEGYGVKGVTVATCTDILSAGLAALPGLGVTPGKLFLNGWSQGAINTQWLHQSLRANGVAVEASAVASPFNDLIQSFRFWTGRENFALPAGTTSYPEVPAWVSLCLIVALGSYELQYGIDGLIEAAVRPKFHAFSRKYWDDYSIDFPEGTEFPTAQGLLVDGFFETFTDDKNSAFIRHLAANVASYWDYDSPIRFHFGLADEAIHPEMVARALSAGGQFVRGVQVDDASHRATFLAALYGDESTLNGNDSVQSWFTSLV